MVHVPSNRSTGCDTFRELDVCSALRIMLKFINSHSPRRGGIRGPRRLSVDAAVLHLGGVQFPVTGPAPISAPLAVALLLGAGLEPAHAAAVSTPVRRR